MTSLILTRLGLNKEWNEKTNSPMFKRKEVEEKGELNSIFYKRKDGEYSIPSVKFFTNMGADAQLETILQTREFQYDVSSPRCNLYIIKWLFLIKYKILSIDIQKKI